MRPKPKKHKRGGGIKMQGEVISFLPRKGYGFIRTDSGLKVFVHYLDIRSKARHELIPGEKVEFLMEETERGPQAFDLNRLAPQPEEPVTPPPERKW